MTYYSTIIDICSSVVGVVSEVSWLSGKVYLDEWRTDSSFPYVFIQLMNDDAVLENINPPTYKHQPSFNIIFRTNGSGMGIVISGVGAIVDKVKSYTTNYLSDGRGWEKVTIGNIDYQYVSPGIPPMVIGEALIPIIIVKEL